MGQAEFKRCVGEGCHAIPRSGEAMCIRCKQKQGSPKTHMQRWVETAELLRKHQEN